MRLFLLFAILAVLPAGAEVVDRVAVAAGTKVITESEIALRIRLTAFQNGELPDLSLPSRQQAAARLIDQKLIEREMEVGRYPHLQEPLTKKLLNEFLQENYNSDPAALVLALTEYALFPEDLEEDLARQADLLTFLNLRFRPAVQVSDDAVRKSFDERTPAGAAADEQAFSSLRAAIEQRLTTEEADTDLDVWLQDQKARTKIVYVERELAPAIPAAVPDVAR